MYTAVENFSVARAPCVGALCKPHPRKFMARDPAIQWYYKDFLGDNKVLAMDWDARGMHIWLLMISIQETPPASIPSENDALRRLLSLPPGSVEHDQTWRRVKPQILAAWCLKDGRYFNAGMERAMERKRHYKESRLKIGTKNERNPKKREEICTENQASLFREEPLENLQSLVEEVGHLHPANEHMKSVALPLAQQEVIAAAIERDGFEVVLSGTKNLADRVAKWPTPELRFIPNPVKFYREAEYLRNPLLWERKFDNGREECALHPGSRRTQSGTCWECNTAKYVSGCQPA